MGYRDIILKMPSDYSDDDLRREIARLLKIKQFTFKTDGKSLDARRKSNIHWHIRVSVLSEELHDGLPPRAPELEIPFIKNAGKVLITGSGPAGFFAAFILQKAGFETCILERGRDVRERAKSISQFESKGVFDPQGNYAFGEGGAGTFSDGKLTSRSKHISLEKRFILDSYIRAGAPGEIAYMAHPHMGSDNLRTIVKNLRESYLEIGGKILFGTLLHELVIKNGHVKAAHTSSGEYEAGHFIMAPGHSSFETYRMLIQNGVKFRVKNFALGSRMEHPQEIINRAQWGRESLPGVKAAEYRLTFNPPGKAPVYTFCMCPGGMVVPATPYSHTNIVNGMSMYRRNLKFANAACVAGINPSEFFGKEMSPPEILDFIETLETRFYDIANAYQAPFCSITDFIQRKNPTRVPETSYPSGLLPYPLWELLPGRVTESMREGLLSFTRKIKGFEQGIIMGLESKTSSPIQSIREEDGRCTGFENLYIAGEGSGYSGGIISSAADGIRTAMKLIRQASL